MTNEAASAEVAPIGEAKRQSVWKLRLTLAGVAAALLAAAVVVPPLIGVGHYQRQVTSMMSLAMGRPVHLSSVELRLLPRPGFVLHDLSVSEDPAFGAEPILSARTVVASLALFSLWKGKPQIDRVSVDEASLNLVRSARGRWNLESLMTGGVEGAANSQAGPARLISASFPYLEATNSRVNFKNGVEKTPFSVVNTDLSLWQDEPGAWRVRLRGQPVRTDMEMSLGDTGEVRLEASLRSAGRLREMPLKLEMEWRDAQLGQLSRLLTGSDAGWRGEVTADINVLGSPESAQTTARLRAVQVRREEFAPDTPLDFDANCNFRYQHSQNAFHSVSCNTAIGNGLLHLKAELPGNAGSPEAMLEVKEVPLQAGLDLLRTVRSDFAPGISARGTANGSLMYKVAFPSETGVPAGFQGRLQGKTVPPRVRDADKVSTLRGADRASVPLTGSITIHQGMLRGGGLKDALQLPEITLTPMRAGEFLPNATGEVRKGEAGPDQGANLGLVLGTRFTLALPPEPQAGSSATRSRPHTPTAAQPSADHPDAPVEGAAQITVTLGVGATGFVGSVAGDAEVSRIRELAYASGVPHLDPVDELVGGTADFAFTGAGPWIPAEFAVVPVQTKAAVSASRALAVSADATPEGSGIPSGSLHLHHAQWKPAYLAHPVDLPQGTVSLVAGEVRLNSEFSFGQSASGAASASQLKDVAKTAVLSPITGTVIAHALVKCKAEDCLPEVQLHFGALDAATLQSALLATPTEKTLLSPILEEVDRMRSSGGTKWPDARVIVQADSLVLGATTLRAVSAQMRIKANEIEIESWQADALGGKAKGTGHFDWAADQPEYAVDGEFTDLTPGQVEGLFGGRWSGGAVSGSGKVTLTGLDRKELAASAAGDLLFEWTHGVVGPVVEGELPQSVRFDRWSGRASILGGRIELQQNTLAAGKKISSLGGVLPFGGPAKLTVAAADSKSDTKPAVPAKR